MGVDLTYFDGNGSAIPVGNVFVNGNVSSRMGISLRKGNIYVIDEVNSCGFMYKNLKKVR